VAVDNNAVDADLGAANGMGRAAGVVAIVAGIIMMVAGGVTWVLVTNQLAAEEIVISDDADCAAGQTVDGPIGAFCQAEVINKHALEATGGLTYAQLDRDDPRRAVAMDASFLRASLFTSVVAYGVAAMAIGLGLLFIVIGLALHSLSRPALR
jgi:hypothetical protein